MQEYQVGNYQVGKLEPRMRIPALLLSIGCGKELFKDGGHSQNRRT